MMASEEGLQSCCWVQGRADQVSAGDVGAAELTFFGGSPAVCSSPPCCTNSRAELLLDRGTSAMSVARYCCEGEQNPGSSTPPSCMALPFLQQLLPSLG